MSSITNLATTALIVVENKIPDVCNLVKKAERKLLIIVMMNTLLLQNWVKLTAENFAARLTQANLAKKTDFDDKLINLNKKINSNKTKHLIV